MKRKTLAVLVAAACLTLAFVAVAFSQDTPNESSDEMETLEVQWLWGEVVSVNPDKNEILVRYMDYDNEEMKEITVTVDEDTTYENVESLAKIKPKDTLSIDYIITEEGKNLAKLVSFEAAESLGEQAPGGYSVDDLPGDTDTQQE